MRDHWPQGHWSFGLGSIPLATADGVGHFQLALATFTPMDNRQQQQPRRDSTSLGRGAKCSKIISPTKTQHHQNCGDAASRRDKEEYGHNENIRSRRGSNSVGRANGTSSKGAKQDQIECGQQDVENLDVHIGPDSVERHRNEKILTTGSIIRLPARSAFYKMFELGSQIGQGNFSDVFLVYNAESGTKFATKEIDKARMRGKLHFVANEIALLQKCRHKHICRMVEAYECQSIYFLVFEYAQKGDLFETIKRVGRLGESLSARISQQIGSALAFLHRRQIVHRDLKPENILIYGDSTVKLTDFGLACVVLGPLFRVCGTPTYVAPEVLTQEGYGVQVDVWSLGIILHICLVGFAPFRCLDRAQLFKQIVRAQLSFDLPCWTRISFNVKQLLLAMLATKPHCRLTADELLKNEWILAGLRTERISPKIEP